MFLLGRYKSVDELRVAAVLNEKKFRDYVKKVPILIVDDDPQGNIDDALRKSGYGNVRMDLNISHLEDVNEYQIVLMDIHNVGAPLAAGKKDLPFEGLSVAEEIKRKYPFKKVIVFSAGLKKYESNYILRYVVDGSFVKDGNLTERNRIIDDCIRRCFDPVLVWKDFRDRLIREDVTTAEIVRLEDCYVRALSKRSPLNAEKVKNILTTANAAISLATELVNCVSLIIPLL